MLTIDSFLSLSLNLNLGLREQPQDFHVVGLWKHIDEAELLEGISPFSEEAEVP